MKIEEVPQDDAGFLKEGKVRDVCYAVDEQGKYRQVLSVGWAPKNEAMQQAWDQVHLKADKIRKKVLGGRLSPLAFHMEKGMMTVSLLAQYTGFSRMRVRKHLKPSGFALASQAELETYAAALNITINQLITV